MPLTTGHAIRLRSADRRSVSRAWAFNDSRLPAKARDSGSSVVIESNEVLTMRADQMTLLAASGEAQIEDRARAHLKSCIPDSCALLSEDELRNTIRWGRRRSRKYGIEREYDFFRYLNLMFMFGVQFDTDPKYPWAKQSLTGKGRPSARMDLLMDYAMLACTNTAEEPAE